MTYTASTSGNYTVIVTNAGGCSGTSAATVVSIGTGAAATTSLSGSADICQGNSVTISASAGSAFAWSNGANAQSITVGTAGTYTVTVYDANGCTSVATPVVVTIKAGGLPSSNITANGPKTFCSGGNVLLTADSNTSYLWSSGETTQSITVNQTGTFSVQVTNAAGCFTNSSNTIVTVKPTPSVSAGSDQTICATPAQLNAVGNANGAPTNPQVTNFCFFDATGGAGSCGFTSDLCGDGYEYISNPTYTQNMSAANVTGLNFKLYYTCNQVTFTFRINGNILGTSTDAGVGCQCDAGTAGTYPKTVSFTQAQVAALWTSGVNVVTVEMNSPNSTALAGISAQLLTPGETYTWTPSTGLNNATIANPIANPATTTNYTVTYLSSNGCFITDDVQVKVLCNEPPVAVCQSVTVSANSNCQGTASASDFNNGSSDPNGDVLTYSISPAGPYSIGATSVMMIVSDSLGESDTCTQTITVIDNQAPTLTNPGNQSLNINSGSCIANYSIGDPISDNCSNSTWGYILSGATTGSGTNIADGTGAGSISFNKGVTTVTLSGIDASSNSATTESFTITVSDNESPIAICKNISLALSASGLASISASDINDGSGDNCEVSSISINKSSFDCTNIGSNTVTLTVTDAAGNSTSCNSTVNIIDNTAPVAVCKNITVALVNGSASITSSDINNGSSDACGIANMSLSQSNFSCSHFVSSPIIRPL